jgi:hypothetical protein
MGRTFAFAAVVAVVASLAAPVAFGGDSKATSVKGYGGQAAVQDQIGKSTTQVKGVKAANAAKAPVTSSAGSLPFTGVDIALLAIGGSVLVLIGFAMRRGSRDAP